MDFLIQNESLATALLGGIIVLLFLGPYIYSIKKKEAKALRRLEITKEKGQDKPLLQHPIINQSECIGCAICTDVCPEGDVLGIINGKATVIHGSHCIGHGKCAEHCPIGAIEIGLGDISEREDIPQLTDNFESNIPGIYITGELSGMALIRNAIEHGVKAINHIHQKNISSNGTYDVIIIGAGPSGLAAGLQASKLGLNYLIIDQSDPGGTILHYPRQKMTLIQAVDIPLFGHLKEGIYQKEDLLEMWEKMIHDFKVNINIKEKLVSIDSEPSQQFQVKTSFNTYSAHHVILALGRRGTPRKLGVPGEQLPKVMYKLMDAESYQNNHILIVGGGDSAIEAALGLAHQPGNTVTISYRKSNFFRLKARNEKNIETAIEKHSLNVIFDSNIMEIAKESVKIKSGSDEIEIPNEFVFIFAGGELPFPLLDSIGIDFSKNVVTKGD